MTSFQIGISPSRRAAARFVGKVRRALQSAVEEERANHGVTQSDIARCIGVHRSVISRELNGRADINLGRIAELAFALGREIEFDLKPQHDRKSNVEAPIPATLQATWSSVAANIVNTTAETPRATTKIEVSSHA